LTRRSAPAGRRVSAHPVAAVCSVPPSGCSGNGAAFAGIDYCRTSLCRRVSGAGLHLLEPRSELFSETEIVCGQNKMAAFLEKQIAFYTVQHMFDVCYI